MHSHSSWVSFVLCIAVMFIGCDQQKNESGDSSGLGDAIGGATQAISDASKDGGGTQSLVDQAKATAEEGAAKAKAASSDGSFDLSKALDGAVSKEKLNELISGLSVEKLQEMATSIKSAINDREGTIQGLKDKLAKAATNLGGSEGADLKKSLEDAQSELSTLKDKLMAVVERLKNEGIDVSQFKLGDN